MNISKKHCKKAPLPYRIIRKGLTNKESELIKIIQNSFVRKYGERISLSTKEMKDWGEFLSGHQIYWDIIVSSPKNWPDWECYSIRSSSDYQSRMRPKHLENHTQVHYYYIPNDLILKMLVSGVLP